MSDSPNNTDSTLDPEATERSVRAELRAARRAQLDKQRFRKKVWSIVGWWSNFLGQPVLAIGLAILAFLALGYAQQQGYFSSAVESEASESSGASDVLYICPMVCVPPTTEPGKCPTCGMDLKPQKISGDSKDKYGLTLNKAAIRIADIQTTVAESKSLTEKISAVGEIDYDEGTVATIAAYVDGRIEKLFADYKGFEVNDHCELAVLYSPDLYLSQVALFQAKKLIAENKSQDKRILDSNQRFYESAKQRLIELGLTETQIVEIEKRGTAENRIKIIAPNSGTVIEKMAEEGKYVKAGQPIIKVADLSTVWLKLELFPEDASRITFGQRVIAKVQSLPNREFVGRVAFVDPTVDSSTQSVPVRIVIPNPTGLLRVGDYATASIEVDVTNSAEDPPPIYDPDLAEKWISPRHPHIIEDKPGTCPICDMDLVPAEQLGFSPLPIAKAMFVTIPRTAVLIVGEQNVAYVETKRGRFEYREIKVGRIIENEVVVESGINAGERVVSKATLLLDSSFNMANKPSLIDPNKIKPEKPEEEDPFSDPEVIEALEKLTDAEKDSVKEQRMCPVGEQILGSMGAPLKLDHNGQTIWVCCEGCIDLFKESPDKYLAVMQELKNSDPGKAEEEKEIKEAIAKLPEEDQKLALAQEICPVAEFRLGSMGAPLKVDVGGQPIFICCEGCKKQLTAEPDKYLEYLRAYAARKELTTQPVNVGDTPPISKEDANKSGDENKESLKPNTAIPSKNDADLPEMKLPEMKAPDLSGTKKAAPENSKTEKKLPEMNLPEMKAPDLNEPKTTGPKKTGPKKSKTEKKLPEMKLPEMKVPEIGSADKSKSEKLPELKPLRF